MLSPDDAVVAPDAIVLEPPVEIVFPVETVVSPVLVVTLSPVSVIVSHVTIIGVHILVSSLPVPPCCPSSHIGYMVLYQKYPTHQIAIIPKNARIIHNHFLLAFGGTASRVGFAVIVG